MKNVYGIILAGGNGERFWPLSTAARPKQFVDVFEGKPLIRHAVDRLEGVIPTENIFIITAERFVALTRKTLPMLPARNVIGEPCRRDTAAAVAVAVGLVRKLGGENAVGCILTADHLMNAVDTFRKTLKAAIDVATRNEAIVTLGVVPDRPETAYGYIEVEDCPDAPRNGRPSFRPAVRFVEKPDLATAKAYVARGTFLWNSGMFIWKASTMARAFADYAPDLAVLIDAVVCARSVKRVLAKTYPHLRSISVDFAVMERVKNILVAKCAFGWNDVGNWNSLPVLLSRDDAGNTRLGRTAVLDACNSIIVSSDERPVALVGIDNVVVVQTPNGTLVCARDRAKDIKKIISEVL